MKLKNVKYTFAAMFLRVKKGEEAAPWVGVLSPLVGLCR